jgi:hypothetical protein
MNVDQPLTAVPAPHAPVEIAYMDESYDSSKFAMSALIIPVAQWFDAFEHLKSWRKSLRTRYGIFVNKELHATKFVSGRGKVGNRVVPKALRAAIFHEAMEIFTKLPGAVVVSGCWDKAGLSDPHAHAFQRIQERLQARCRKGSGYIITIADEGRAAELRKVSRRSKVYNPVGSMFGGWPGGSSSKNIPNDRLVEDPVFRDSAQSYFLQAVDFVAFALLKSETSPTPRVKKHALDAAYDRLGPVCVTAAHRRDPRGLGIVRT